MDNKKFVDELKNLCDKFGADVYVEMRNSKGSPLAITKASDIKGKILRECQLSFVKIVPNQIEEGEKDGETSIHSDTGEV